MTKKILVVDDDADLRQLMKTLLKAYEVTEAGGKAQALSLLNKNYVPDLIVLDVMMESMTSGFDLAQEIARMPGLRAAKILIMTNVDKELNFDFKSEAGDSAWLPVHDYLNKPIDPKMFLAKVQGLLS